MLNPDPSSTLFIHLPYLTQPYVLAVPNAFPYDRSIPS